MASFRHPPGPFEGALVASEWVARKCQVLPRFIGFDSTSVFQSLNALLVDPGIDGSSGVPDPSVCRPQHQGLGIQLLPQVPVPPLLSSAGLFRLPTAWSLPCFHNVALCMLLLQVEDALNDDLMHARDLVQCKPIGPTHPRQMQGISSWHCKQGPLPFFLSKRDHSGQCLLRHVQP